MKTQVLSTIALGLLLAVTSCKDSAASKITQAEIAKTNEIIASSQKVPILEIDKKLHDFGTINEGDKVETEFILTNKGEADLVIIDAKASCGCTVPVKPSEPIKPGKSAPIKVSFDSNGKPGQQEKSITITANTESGIETCSIKANVIAKKAPGLNK